MNAVMQFSLSCNICDSRIDAWEASAEGQDKCPRCQSVGRHRAVAMTLGTRKLCNCSPALDFGGDGSMFRAKVPRLLSLDLSYRGADLLANLQHLPLRDNCIELALCLDVLEHVESDLAAAQEMYRVLKVGGTAILTFSCWAAAGPSKSPDEVGMWKWHLDMSGTWTALCYRYYTNESALDLLNTAGFRTSILQCRRPELGVAGADVFLATKGNTVGTVDD